jgi:hypothetical protein
MDPTLVASIAAAAGFVAKVVWDWFYARRREWESLALAKSVEVLDLQLSEFYWPLYIRLEKNEIIWTRILDVGEQDETRRRLAEEIERGVILPNHAEITAIIETRMHLAEADVDFRRELLHYIHHVTLHKALRAAGDTCTFPMDYGVAWPAQLFPMVKRRTEALQREYDLQIGRQGRVHRASLEAFVAAFDVR